MPCPLCFNWATSDFICLPKRVCFNASWQNENKPTWEAHEMGAGGLSWPGTEMMSPLPSAGPWATLPQRLCLSLLKWTHYKTTLMYPGDTRWNVLCDTKARHQSACILKLDPPHLNSGSLSHCGSGPAIPPLSTSAVLWSGGNNSIFNTLLEGLTGWKCTNRPVSVLLHLFLLSGLNDHVGFVHPSSSCENLCRTDEKMLPFSEG